MSDLKNHERAAIEAVARHFSSKWEKRSGAPGVCMNVAGKRVAIGVVTLKRHGAGQGSAPRPHLRFDKVATGLIERLEAALAKAVPSGTTVIVTITAPVRLAGKTAAALTEKIQTLLALRSPSRDEKATIYGNRIRIRFVRDGSSDVPKVIGFVHNPETDPHLLLSMASELLDLATAEARRRAAKVADERWLVLISARGVSCLEAYRYAYSRLRPPTNLKKVFVVFAGGRVGPLFG